MYYNIPITYTLGQWHSHTKAYQGSDPGNIIA